MTTIWKYPLDLKDEQVVKMPQGAQILSVQRQFGNLMLWALVDSKAPSESREIIIAATGAPFPNVGIARHIGTVQMLDGALIWHVFEKAKKV